MYFQNKLKPLALVFIVLGAIGLFIGFYKAPRNLEEAKAKIEVQQHHEEHSYIKKETHGATIYHEDTLSENDHSRHNEGHKDVHHGGEHEEHLLHKLQNKPWAALYVSALFFMMIALGVLVFYAIQRVSQAGWSPVLFRVMEGITAYLFPGLLIVFLLLLISSLHGNHLFIWMDRETVAHDKILQGKTQYLNVPFFLIRAIFYITGWNLYRYYSRKFSLAQDKADDYINHKKNFRISAGFLVFYIVTESLMSWDWIMSIDPHWFSTLFGWYVFASMFVTGITVIALVTIYLKSRGYLTFVNDSHIHDLGKFMFAISIFWTYLWFSQFMLIWYSNIPEEVTYFITRMEDYSLLFFGMLVMNFVFPLLILMNSDYKRINYFIVMTGIVIVLGHYTDVFVMIMPSAVGDQWSFGWSEIGSFLLFLGLFILIVFRALAKTSLLVKGDPYLEESKRFQY